MANKIGKYSTGLDGSVKMAKTPYGQSNQGYDARMSLMGDDYYNKHEKTVYGDRHTATGKRVLEKPKNVTKRM